MDISKRLSDMPASGIRKLVPLAQAAKTRGVRVFHLNIGDPDIKTPEVMLQALHDWDRNPIGYGNSQGEPELLTALAGYYQGLGFSFVNKEHIQVTIGGSEALFMAFMATCDERDEIIVFEPFFTAYLSQAAAAGVTLVPVETALTNGFHLPNKREIEAKITPRTKAILYTNPNNPTGTVLEKREVELLVEIAKAHGLFLLADEVYREYAFDGRETVSLFHFMQELPEQLLVLDSLSKRYSVCGLRLGMLVSLNQKLMAGVLKVAMGRLSAGVVDQGVAAKLAEVPQTFIEKVRDEYQRRRDIVFEGLSGIEGVTIRKPEGAFYCVAQLPVEDAEAYCAWLLTDFNDNQETVMLSPMAGFYATPGMGRREVRIAYVLEVEKLKRAVELIRLGLVTYSER